MIVKGSEADGPDKGNQASSIPGRLAHQGRVSERSTSEHSDRGRPDTVLRVDNKSGEVRTQTYPGVLLCGLLIPPRFSPCNTYSREIAPPSGIDPKSKDVLTARCLMSLIGLLASMQQMVEEGRLHMRPFQFHLKEH